MDTSLIILALETLREQVSDGADWNCRSSRNRRLERIDEQIDLMKVLLRTEY